MKKFIKIASVLAALSLFAGCKTQLNPAPEADNKAYIKVSADNNPARTIMPTGEYNKEDYIYELWGSKYGSTDVKLGSWLSYSAMTSASAIEIEPATWDFTLYAFKDNNVELSGTLEDRLIMSGSTTLKFVLTDQDGSDGYGKIDYKFYFEQPVEYSGYATLTLLNEDGSTYTTPSADISEANIVYSCSDTTEIEIINNKAYRYVTYKNDKIKKGFYIVRISVYDTSYSYKTLLNSYTETIRVAAGMTSTGKNTLSLNNYSTDLSEITPVLNSNGSYIYWTPVKGAASYKIYEYESENSYYTSSFDASLFTAPKETTVISSYSNLTHKADKYIYYAIKAENGNGSSNFSNVVIINRFSAPNSVSVSETALNWNNVAGATGYQVFTYSTTEDINVYNFDTENFGTPVSVSTTSYAITSSSTDYTYYAVKAVCGSEITDFSSIYKVPPFSAPGSISKSGNTISWDPVVGATGYKLYSYTTTADLNVSDFDTALFTATPAELTSTSATHTTSTTKYTYYAVKATNGTTDTDFSDVVKFAPFTAPAVSYAGGKLSWASVDGAASYYLYRYNSSTQISDTSTISFPSTPDSTTEGLSHIPSSLSLNTYYYYKVRAYDGSTYSEYSNIVEIEKFSTTAEYLENFKAMTNGGTYTVQTNDSTNISDFTEVEWTTTSGTFLSFTVEPNTTYYLDGVDGYKNTWTTVSPAHDGTGLTDANYDIYKEGAIASEYKDLDNPSNKAFTTGSTASTYYIIIRPFSSSKTTGKATFRIYKIETASAGD